MKPLIYRLTYPLAQLYWRIFRPKTFGVKVIIEDQGRYLLIKNSYGGERWTFPGGGMKRTESPEEAAHREISEEIGFKLQDVKFIGSFTTSHEGKIDTVHVLTGSASDSEPAIDGEEVIDARWFAKDALPESLGVMARKTLDTLNQKAP